MNLEIFAKDLEEISEKINKLEIEEAKDSYKSSWWMYGKYWPDKKTCLEKKAIWQNLKKDIERKINLIKEAQNNANIDKKNNYLLLLNKYSNKLSKAEGNIAGLEARLTDLKATEESNKIGWYFFMAIIIILLVFFLYLIATGKILSKETGINSK